MKKIVTLPLLSAVLMLSAAVGGAAADGGKSAYAKSCQKGGWQNWVRQDKTPFTNQGDCVSYAAQGGVLTLPTLGF